MEEDRPEEFSMMEGAGPEISSVRFTVEVGSEWEEPENLRWQPDAAPFVLQIRKESGDITERRYGHTCLEHAFLLLNRLETKESGWLLWGTGVTEICFEGDDVILFGGLELVGSVGETRTTTEHLIEQMLGYLAQQGVDTEEVVEEIVGGRFAPWKIDPEEVHTRLMSNRG